MSCCSCGEKSEIDCFVCCLVFFFFGGLWPLPAARQLAHKEDERRQTNSKWSNQWSPTTLLFSICGARWSKLREKREREAVSLWLGGYRRLQAAGNQPQEKTSASHKPTPFILFSVFSSTKANNSTKWISFLFYWRMNEMKWINNEKEMNECGWVVAGLAAAEEFHSSLLSIQAKAKQTTFPLRLSSLLGSHSII